MSWRQTLGSDLRTLLWGPPERIEPEGNPWEGPLYFRQTHRLRDLLLVTDQLLAIVRSNASLSEGADAAAADAPAYHLKRLFAGLADDLDSGVPLWRCLERRWRFFPAYYVGLVRAAEESGRLAESFSALREVLLQAAELRSRAVQYAAYIAAVWLAVFATGTLLIRYVMPSFSQIIEDFGAEKPYLFSYLLDLGARPVIVMDKIALLILVYIAFRSIGWLSRRNATVASLLGRAALAIPLVRGLVAKRHLAHTASVLETLLRARVPLNEALDIASLVDPHPVYAGVMERARERVEAGVPLSEALVRERAVPRSFRGFVSVGESSGRLPEALERIRHLYRRQVARTERILLDVISPLGILAAACVVLLFFSSLLSVTASAADALMVP